MSYSAEISRENPSCFIFLIDQSGSMSDTFGSGESTKKKSEALADAINKLLQNLVIKCAKAEGVRNYYHVGVIGYGNNQNSVGSAFSGPLNGKEMVPISDIATSPARIEERSKKVEDGAGGLVDQKIKFPIWFEPIANGGTPMCQAFGKAKLLLQNWINQNPNCFPPIVINITDGEATDGDPLLPANELKNVASSDGNVLLFNLHLSSNKSSPILFPDDSNVLPDDYAKKLFEMSSNLPNYMRNFAQQEGHIITENSRGFVFNADIISVIQFLDIGTRPSNLR